MKTLILLLLMVPVIGFAQTATSIKNFNDKIKESSNANVSGHSSHYAWGYDKTKPVDNKMIANRLLLSEDTVKGLQKKYMYNVRELYQYFSFDFIPMIGYANYDVVKFELDKKLILFIDGGSTSNVYNTLRSTAKQRASQVLAKHILPAVKELAQKLPITGIDYVAITITWGSKDFSQEDYKNRTMRSEYLCSVFPITEILKFASNTITQEEFISKSHFYLQDQESKLVNKISIVLE